MSMRIKMVLLALGLLGGLVVGLRRGAEEYGVCLETVGPEGVSLSPWLCALRAAQYFVGTPILTALLMLGLILVIEQRRRR